MKNTIYLLIDLQDKILNAMHDNQRVFKKSLQLVKGFKELGVKTYFSEQYPQGLGRTNQELLDILDDNNSLSKNSFSAVVDHRDFFNDLKNQGVQKIICSGIESHVCLYLTSMDLKKMGFEVVVIDDASSSRDKMNHKTAMRNLRDNGIDVLPTETVLFDYLESAKNSSFKNISKIIK